VKPGEQPTGGPRADRPAAEAFRSLVAATADKVGEEFFRQLVKHVALALGVSYAFVAEFAGSPTRVRTIALWGEEGWLDNVEYDLAGTPCEEVVRGSLCRYESDVHARFPEDQWLTKIGARGYLGVPLRAADGQTLGHLAVIDTKPMPGEPAFQEVFQLFADRARVELERLRADAALEDASRDLRFRLERTTEDLRHARDQLTALVEIQRAVAGHLERAALFMAVAEALQGVIPVERVILLLPGSDPAVLTVYAASGKTGIQFFEGETIPRADTIAGWVVAHGRAFVVGRADEARQRFPVSYARIRQEGMESVAVAPLLAEGRCVGALALMSQEADALTAVPSSLLEQIAAAVAVAVDHCVAYEELQSLRDRLARENVYLQEEIRREHPFEELVGSSPALLAILHQVEQVAPTDTSVLILGETGTGKELIARAIHNRSTRRDRPLVKVNCAAISAGLVESELFGHVKGAFTGALERRVGRFELADGGTIFLDEIGELPLETQVKLLRVLQEQEFEPVGSNRSVRVNVRVIAATNRDLAEAIRAGRFRTDLFYRLNVFPIEIPPLRSRRSDIPQLVTYFLSGFSKKFGKRIGSVSPQTMARLTSYGWPGNVRELQNIVERAAVLCEGSVLELDQDLVPVREAARVAPEIRDSVEAREAPAAAGTAAAEPRESTPAELPTLEEAERRHIVAALERTGGVIHGAHGAARILDLHPNTLRSRMERLGIKVPRARREPS
jgi:formate hydrogenlyase transcriptional activator